MAFFVFLLSLFGVAQAADSTGILKVNASVKGAEVWLDGQVIGPAPVLKYVPVGAHALRVVADNHEPFVRAITVETDKTVEVNAQLQPGSGSVEFQGPAGTAVTFNGKSYTLPVRIPSPGAGTWTWTASAAGYEDSAGSLQTVAGRNYLLDVQLGASAGVVGVTSNPAGATVTLDGVEMGVTPAKKTSVPEGRHGVQIALAGYATEFQSIDTTGGKRGTVDVKLGKDGAAVTVETGGADAQVFFADAPVGTGTKVNVPLVAPGRLDVTVIRGADTFTGTVRVPDSGALSLQISGKAVVQKKPLTQRWGFWAAVGGGAVAAGAGAAVVAVATAPEPPPAGDTVARLP